MTVEEVATAVTRARSHVAECGEGAQHFAVALSALAALAEDRERLLDSWKEVMCRSPLGPAGPELANATTELMNAEAQVRRAIGHNNAND